MIKTKKPLIRLLSFILSLLALAGLLDLSVFSIADSSESPAVKAVAEDKATPGDSMVYLTQKWLNQQYGKSPGFGSVKEDGVTGWDTVNGLLRALQYELGVTMDSVFGTSTSARYEQNLLYRQDGVTNRKFAILQGALWCKGYCPGYYLREEKGVVIFDEVFNANVEKAVIELKKDIGFINPNGVVTLNVMKALMSMDGFKLLSAYGGKAEVRAMQQKLNRKYEDYTGLIPCDGLYGRRTNKALIYAVQAEEGFPLNIANGSFGPMTKLCCPEIPYTAKGDAARSYPGTSSGKYYTTAQIKSFTELMKFGLYFNGFGNGAINGTFDSVTVKALKDFQKKHALPVTGKGDIATWMSLMVSCGDPDRSALACDCATILTAEKAKTLYDNGYRYVGRYLTGTYGNNGASKALTKAEAKIIFDAKLRYFPIYQAGATKNAYFTPEQGTSDANAAIAAARALEIPKGTIIYFAVDFDAMDYQVTSNIIPYFEKVYAKMSKSIYKTGIYGARNVCKRVAAQGYSCSSFVADMSTGYSGNMGFRIPDDWAFDQFTTVAIGTGAGRIEIDKNGFSGRDKGVAKFAGAEVKVTSVKLNKTTQKLTVGGTATLKPTISPSNATNKGVTWKSSKSSVATVNKNGKVTAKSPGKATITVTTNDGNKKANCTVNVKPKRPGSVKAKVVTATSVQISWNKAAGATNYQIRRATSKDGLYKAVKTTAGTSFTDTERTAGKTYYYKVRSFKTVDGARIYSTCSSAVSVKPKPLKVTGVKAVKLESGKAEISWKEQANISGYQIARSTSETGTYKSVGSTTKLIFTDTKLTPGKTYYYKVRAYKTVSGKRVYGEYSAVRSIEA